jgi:hypothetical protein
MRPLGRVSQNISNSFLLANSRRDRLFSQILKKDRLEFYKGLQQRAATEGEKHDIAIQTHIVTGDEVEAVVAFLDEQKSTW